MTDYNKIPPQAIDIEEAILGLFLIEKESQEYVDKITREMFYKDCNDILFNAINELRLTKSPIDILTITDYLRNNDKLESIGGVDYISKITKHVVLALSLDRYIAILKENYIKREIITASLKLSELSYSGDNIEECQTMLTDLNKFIDENIIGNIKGTSILKLATETIDNAARRMNNFNDGIINGINTGFALLQQITGGWQKGDLIYIPSRPSMGKTAIAIHFAKCAVKRGFKVLFFSLEMSKLSITDRFILGETDIDPTNWRNGQITESDLQEYEEKNAMIKKWSLEIYDKPAVKPSEIKSICRKELPDIIFVDYLQLMQADRNNYQNRNIEVGSISHELKTIAKEFNIPVLACLQLSRKLEDRAIKVPMLSDLRESGDLEQDADIVIFPYRPYVYSKADADIGAMNLIISKHRNGRLDIIYASHNEYINDFFDKPVGIIRNEF